MLICGPDISGRIGLVVKFFAISRICDLQARGKATKSPARPVYGQESVDGPDLRSDIRLKESVMAKTNPAQFVRQVRQEANKVTWPTRKETGIATAMVFVMVTIMSLFFLVVDEIIALGIQLILGT